MYARVETDRVALQVSRQRVDPVLVVHVVKQAPQADLRQAALEECPSCICIASQRVSVVTRNASEGDVAGVPSSTDKINDVVQVNASAREHGASGKVRRRCTLVGQASRKAITAARCCVPAEKIPVARVQPFSEPRPLVKVHPRTDAQPVVCAEDGRGQLGR